MSHSRFLILVPIAVFAVTLFLVHAVPSEDAHIIYRYSENFAHGRGIVYNDAPVEGCTEMLWMLVLTVPALIGANLPVASQAINVIISIAVIVLIFKRAGLFPSLIVAVSPITVQSLAGYGTPLFVLLIVLMVIARKEGRVYHYYGLLLSVARPEGAALWALMIAFDRKRAWSKHLAYAVALLVVYLDAKFLYFGYFLPNTFYVKAYVPLTLDAIMRTLFVIAAIVVAGIFTPHSWWRSFLPLAIFALLYLCVSQADNIGDRFQFPALAGALALSCPATTKRRLRLSVAAFVLLFAACLYESLSAEIKYDDRVAIGKALKSLGRPLTLCVTEAGYLPYYSGLRTIDAYGLNDRIIAHEGLTQEYLESQNIDIVMFRMYHLWDSSRIHPTLAWRTMIKTIVEYCKVNGQEIVYVYASRGNETTGTGDYLFYSVRRGLLDSALYAAITAKIKK